LDQRIEERVKINKGEMRYSGSSAQSTAARLGAAPVSDAVRDRLELFAGLSTAGKDSLATQKRNASQVRKLFHCMRRLGVFKLNSEFLQTHPVREEKRLAATKTRCERFILYWLNRYKEDQSARELVSQAVSSAVAQAVPVEGDHADPGLHNDANVPADAQNESESDDFEQQLAVAAELGIFSDDEENEIE